MIRRMHRIEDSDLVAAHGYDRRTTTMQVEFKNGRRYVYRNVPMRTYLDVINAPSVGVAFHKLVRPFPERFPFRELT